MTTTRQGATVAIAVLAVVLLAGCEMFSKPPEASVMNRSDRSATLLVTGTNAEPKEFPANEEGFILGASGPIEGRGVCEGDGYVLTDTATSEILATSDQPVCSDAFVEIQEDGTID